jgi:hypothetical protein
MLDEFFNTRNCWSNDWGKDWHFPWGDDWNEPFNPSPLKPEKTPTFNYPERPKTPHRCPVCGGKGIVPNGFYSSTEETWSTTSVTPETCRSCSGSGIIIL